MGLTVERKHDDALRPLADWDDDRSAPPGVLWWSRLDERYQVEARRLPARRVLLVAFDRGREDELVGRAILTMTGEPCYGPVPDDIRDWQAAVESWVTQRPATVRPAPDRRSSAVAS